MKLHYLMKKLAVVTALAVAITAVPVFPASHVQAAAAPAFKTTRSSLYENGSSKGTYTYTVKNIKKGYTIKWSLSGAGVDFAELQHISRKATGTTSSNKITIQTAGDIKAKDCGLTVVAKVYNTSGKLVKTLKDNVKLKISATTISLKTNKIKDSMDSLSIGKAYDFDRTLFPYNSTSKTYWTVTDSTGADHSSEITSAGIWTPTKEGSYTVAAIARNAKTSKDLCKATINAVVGSSISSITQTAINEFKLVFSSDVSKEVTVNNLTIKETNGVATVLPKSVTFSKDGKTATVTTHTNFRNAASYTVSCIGLSKTFTASAGEVARIAILTDSVPVNVATPIEYALYDANGIDVKAAAKGSLEFSASLTNGYLTEKDEIFLTTLGKGGSITITYTEGVNKFTATKNITCREAEAIEAASSDFTITDSSAAPDFTSSDYKPKTTISIGDTGYAHFRALDSSKKPINYTNISYASSDDNVLIIESSGKMLPIKEGSVVIIVKAFEGTVETNYTFTVTVQPKKKLTSIGLSTYSVAMSNCGDENYKKYIDIIPYDQFGNKMTLQNCTVTITPAGNSNPASAKYNDTTGQIEVSVPAYASAGTYAFKVTAVFDSTSLSQNFSLIVQNVPYDSTAIGYTLELDGGSNTVDISMKDGDPAEGKVVYVRLAKKQGGVFAGYSYFDTAVIRKDNLYYTADLTTAGTSTQSTIYGGMSIPIVLTKTDIVGGSNVIQKAAVGTYSVVVTLNNRQYTLGLTITDSQNAPAVSVKSTTSSKTVTNALALVQDCLNIPNGYELIDCTAVGSTATGASIPVSSGGKLHIQTITLRHELTLKTSTGADQKTYVTYTVNVGQTLTNK